MPMEESKYMQLLLAANDIDPAQVANWVLCPGMAFNAADKWWGDLGLRDAPHEGIDLCLFADHTGRIHRFDESTRIPAAGDGLVQAVFRDYLGQAVVVEHPAAERGDGPLLSVYAHTTPNHGLHPGATVKKGDVIATIADTSRSKARILPHLHLSVGLPKPGLTYDNFVWNDMRDPEKVVLLDPTGWIGWPLDFIDKGHRHCFES